MSLSHIVRGFVGAARAIKSDTWLNIGELGQGDLPGWFSVELSPYGRIALKLEVEIKSLKGTLSPGQKKRRDELARAGALYISAKSVASVVGQLVAAREALKWAALPAGFKGQAIQREPGNMQAALQGVVIVLTSPAPYPFPLLAPPPKPAPIAQPSKSHP